MKIRTIWKSASCALATLLCCFSLRAQTAAEYKERAETEKSWPKEAVRGAHGRTRKVEGSGTIVRLGEPVISGSPIPPPRVKDENVRALAESSVVVATLML